MTRNSSVLLTAFTLALVPALALAHAQLRSADPPVGGSVQGAPAQVEITFSEAVEPQFSTIKVTNEAGQGVDRGNVHVPGTDAHRLVVSLPPLRPGQYRVEWHATSVDTHKTEGSYTFTVAP
jgi:methionine-rich copper-binding protein CopC